MSIKKMLVLLGTLIIAAAVLVACAGEPGPAGPPGPEGPAGPVVADVVADAHMDLQPETCGICHKDAGQDHQAVYNDYADASTLGLTINSVKSVSGDDGKFNATMTFTITKNGQPYLDKDGLPGLAQKRFYTVKYDSATEMFTGSQSFSDIKAVGNGVYTAEAVGMAYRPEAEKSEAYGYVGDDVLATEGMTLYANVANAGLAFGDAASYESAANVEGCEKCHGTPYMKHGYRAAAVDGLADFAACKTCHYDDRNGNHADWQVLVDNPARYAELHAGAELTDDEKAQYAYTANVMNDVHMSHAMEFPYPQSMANCATCHEGKLDVVLSDANFQAATCKSCHAVNGAVAEGEEPAFDTTVLALNTIIPHGFDETADCATCHSAEAGLAPVFSEIHTGYDKTIYAADGTRYSDVFTVSIDEASFADNMLTVKFSAAKDGDASELVAADIIPTVMVGLYGYDTKDFIVQAHGRDEDKNRLLEFQVAEGSTNPRFTVVSAANGSWEITADLSLWADMIADGTVKRAEIVVMPLLAQVVGEIDSHDNGETDDTAFAVNAPSRTFDLGANAFDDEFYSDIVNVADGCNTCHDALATTFHSPDRGGNVTVCRVCHVTTSGGSHLEMQSRSIDSYVHAIHSFQAFDPGDIDFTDPVAATKYDMHTEHVYPNFTIKNCESCHNAGTFNTPDQSKSLPGLLSASDTFTGRDRNIGDVPAVVTGPATRACGGCHRAQAINEDSAGELAMLTRHWTDGGYIVEAGEDAEGTLNSVIDQIMALFK